MKFVSLFSPASINTDPIMADEGALYYNTASNSYRAFLGGNWVSLVDENNVHSLTSNSIIEYGDESTVGLSITLNESFENNTIYAISSSVTYIVIDNSVDYPVRIGGEVHIVRGGSGELQVISASPSISLLTPSNIYATSQWDTVTVLKLSDNSWLLQSEFRDLY